MTLEEYDIQQLTCKKCGHIKVTTTNVIKSIANDSYRCEVCFNEDGVLHNQNTTRCSQCSQVWRSNQSFLHIRGCPVAKDNLFKIEIDPFHKWRKDKSKSLEQTKIDNEIDFQKSQRILKDRLSKLKQEPIERQVRIEALLTKIADLLDKKEPEVKVKTINHGAIQ